MVSDGEYESANVCGPLPVLRLRYQPLLPCGFLSAQSFPPFLLRALSRRANCFVLRPFPFSEPLVVSYGSCAVLEFSEYQDVHDDVLKAV